MPRRKRKTIIQVNSMQEACNAIAAGIIYFLKTHTLKTVLVLGFLMSGPAYIAWDWATSYRVQIKEALPIQEAKPVSANFSLMPSAIAGETLCKDSILIHGFYYGCWDKSFILYVVKDQGRIIVHDENTQKTYDTYFPYFKEQRMKQSK
jgi:hypothetical protein